VTKPSELVLSFDMETEEPHQPETVLSPVKVSEDRLLHTRAQAFSGT
jgi:hypothetical protein